MRIATRLFPPGRNVFPPDAPRNDARQDITSLRFLTPLSAPPLSALTRKHRCGSLDELLQQVYDWTTAGSFYFQTASFRELYALAA